MAVTDDLLDGSWSNLPVNPMWYVVRISLLLANTLLPQHAFTATLAISHLLPPRVCRIYPLTPNSKE